MKIKYGTRGSKLALFQSRLAVETAKKDDPQVQFEEIIIKTVGDRVTNMPLFKIGGQGLFIQEIEQALIDKTIDIAVHSLKDLPGELRDGLCLLAVGCSEDPSDCLITAKGKQTLKDLPEGAKIGTSSLRRRAQLSVLRNDLVYTDLRGNLDTRLKKLEAGEADAIVLAAAGLNRLGLSSKASEHFSLNSIIPAVGQGLLAIECRCEDKENLLKVFKSFADEKAMVRTRTEREFLRILQGGCKTPTAAYADVTDQDIMLQVFYADDNCKNSIKSTFSGKLTEPESLGKEAALEILEHRALLNSGL